MKNVLITGGCGFIGSNLAVSLAQAGYNVVCFDNLSRRGSEILLSRILEKGCTFHHGDIRNEEDFAKLDLEFDLMIECSAEPSVLVGSRGADALFMINNNLYGSVNCFEYCRKTRTPVIFLSTSRVYPYDLINSLKFEEGDTRFQYYDSFPGISDKGISVNMDLKGLRSLYGATKLASEYILQEYSFNYGIPSIINRCGVIAGPWQLGKVDQGVFTYWLAMHYFKMQLRYIGFGGKGKQVRDLLHIDDLIDLIHKQINVIDQYHGGIFNVGGGTLSNLSLRETTTLCREITGHKLEIQSETTNRPADIIWFVTDNGKTENEFQWKPTAGARKTLSDIFNWMIDNEDKFKKLFGN